MDINHMMGLVRAALVQPGDTLVIKVDRYLTGQQLAEIDKHFKRKLGSINTLIIGKDMDFSLVKIPDAQVSA